MEQPASAIIPAIARAIYDRGDGWRSDDEIADAIEDYGEDAVWAEHIGPMLDAIGHALITRRAEQRRASAPRVFLVDTKDDGGWGNTGAFANAEAVVKFFITGANLPEAEADAIRTAIADAEAHPGQEFSAPGDWNEAWLTVTYAEIRGEDG